jgi:hypothetical protein
MRVAALRAKLRLFRDGDPDLHEFSEFTDFATLETSDGHRHSGVVRILSDLVSGRFRLLMRSSDAASPLLNHFLLPGQTLTTSVHSVTYSVDNYVHGRTDRAQTFTLRFDGIATCDYFREKFAFGVACNDDLIPRQRIRQFPPPADAESLQGIIHYLSAACGGNVHDTGAVIVSCSTKYEDFHPKSLLELAADSRFISKDQPDQWVCYDFGDRTVRPTHYTIRSDFTGPNRNDLKDWVVEGSVDGEGWTLLDERKDNAELYGKGVRRRFEISIVVEVRMFRLRQTGLNHCRRHALILSAIEIFGDLIGE